MRYRRRWDVGTWLLGNRARPVTGSSQDEVACISGCRHTYEGYGKTGHVLEVSIPVFCYGTTTQYYALLTTTAACSVLTFLTLHLNLPTIPPPPLLPPHPTGSISHSLPLLPLNSRSTRRPFTYPLLLRVHPTVCPFGSFIDLRAAFLFTCCRRELY